MGITKRFNGTQLEQELTKPCPLMPDGEWTKNTMRFGYDPEQASWWYTVDCSSSKVAFRIDGSNITSAEKTYFTPTTSGWYIGTLRKPGNLSVPDKGFGLAECRMYFPIMEHSWADQTLGTQGSKGWLIYKNSSFIMDLYIIASDLSAVLGKFTVDNLTEDTIMMECVVCAYVYKITT